MGICGIIAFVDPWEPNPAVKEQRQAVSYQAMMRTLAQLLRPWRLNLALLQSNWEGLIKVAYPFTFWAAAALALFCFKIW
jgi:hypothetical protein